MAIDLSTLPNKTYGTGTSTDLDGNEQIFLNDDLTAKDVTVNTLTLKVNAGVETIKNETLAARDATNLASGVFETIAAGLVGTAEGSYFSVNATNAFKSSKTQYASTTAGIAGTVDGEYFTVPVSMTFPGDYIDLVLYKNILEVAQPVVESESFITLYKKVGGVAVLIEEYPSVKAIESSLIGMAAALLNTQTLIATYHPIA